MPYLHHLPVQHSQLDGHFPIVELDYCWLQHPPQDHEVQQQVVKALQPGRRHFLPELASFTQGMLSNLEICDFFPPFFSPLLLLSPPPHCSLVSSSCLLLLACFPSCWLPHLATATGPCHLRLPIRRFLLHCYRLQAPG